MREPLLKDLEAKNVLAFQKHLKKEGKSLNTQSTYLRNLRAIRNYGVKRGLVESEEKAFHGCYLSHFDPHPSYLYDWQIEKILCEDLEKHGARKEELEGLEHARLCFALMYGFGGMPFVDLATLNKSNFNNGLLIYRRHKTNVEVQLKPTRMQKEIGRRLHLFDNSSYLYPILKSDLNIKSEEGYKAYMNSLRVTNNRLKRIGQLLKINNITTYSARHSFANNALRMGLNPYQLMGLMGHSNIKTTEIYLNKFKGEENGKLLEQIEKKLKRVKETYSHPR